ncbi:MAG: hypothetical protein M1813_000733 [Trichoglossum hirsutum]|jgi:hypothetical protein|nr:MAG: hypothetical protein M1813_000733 [Trichoglossum hirsutum]
MRIYIVVLIAALTSAGAIRVNKTDPDGLYFHEEEADGTILTHYAGLMGNQPPQLVRRSPPENTPSTAEVYKRDTGAHCNNLSGSPRDMLAAQGGLANHFGENGQTFKKGIHYQSGNAVAYGCDYGGGQKYNECQFSSDVDAIDSKCGKGGAGWSSHESWKSSYGRTLASESFC